MIGFASDRLVRSRLQAVHAPLIDDPDVDPRLCETVGGEEACGACTDDEDIHLAFW